MKTKIKLISIVALAIICVIVVLQNRTSVETKILFLTITMPRALLLFLTTLAGFILGIVVTMLVQKKGGQPSA
jgi:uncharacterized integral membrane protein